MPTIILDKKRIFRSLNKELSLEELERLLEYLKCEIKEEKEDELICEITTDRADCFTTEGIIRALKGILGMEKGLIKFDFFDDEFEVYIDENVSNVRPYVVMATVRGVKLDVRALESIIRFQEVLHETLGRNRRKASIGIYDISKLDKKIYYKCLPLDEIKFRPLDKDELMNGYRILNETEKGIQYKHLIPEKKAPVLIDSKGTFLSLAPIINSQDAKVTVRTTDILIDSTGFDINFITSIVSLMAYAISFYGGKIGLLNHHYPNKSFKISFKNRNFVLEKNYVEDILGFSINDYELEDILLRARYGIEKKDNKYNVEVPFYRLDVLNSIDIIEDIAIIKGYSNIELKSPILETRSKISNKSIIARTFREIFNGFGFQEVTNYMICNSETQTEKVMLNKEEIGLILLVNPISKEYDCIRANIFPCLLDFLYYNRSYSYPQKIYEIGDVIYYKSNSIHTDFRFSSLIIHNDASFEEMHSFLYSSFKVLNLDFRLRGNDLPFLLNGRRADIIVGDENIGWIGEINPEISIGFSLYQPIVACELSLSKILKFIYNK
jgi:phenylalanyl-tRNA synthetase beta chain